MDERLLNAYFEYASDLVRAGIIDDSLTENLDDDRPLDERIADVLRAAGRLLDGWDQAGSQRGWHITAVTGDHWHILSTPQAAMPSPIRRSHVQDGHARLRRADLAHAS